MSMRLAKNNTPAFQYYTEDGVGTTPIRANLTLDGSGGTVTADSVDPVWVIFENSTGGIATIEGHPDNPAGPLVELINEQAGLDWQLSADGSTGWGNSLTLGNQNVSGGPQTVRIYARCVATNDGSIAVNNYVQAKFRTKCEKKPAA